MGMIIKLGEDYRDPKTVGAELERVSSAYSGGATKGDPGKQDAPVLEKLPTDLTPPPDRAGVAVPNGHGRRTVTSLAV